MIWKSITKCTLVSFVLLGLIVNTTIAAGDGYDSAEAEAKIYWKGLALIIALLVGLLAVALNASKRSHQETN